MSSIEDSHAPPAAHKSTVHKTSEFLGAVMYLLCATLQRVFPLATVGIPDAVRFTVASILFILGILTIRSTHAVLAEYQQPHQPGRPTTRLITTGVFRYSRHPTYFACVAFFMPGAGFLSNNAWILLLAVPVGVPLFYFVLVRPEEKYLREQFPDEYKRYCQETTPWFGIPKRIS